MTQLPSRPRPMHGMLGGAAALASALAIGCSDGAATSPRMAPHGASLDRAQPAFVISTIDVEGALSTVPQGINAGGAVAGYYISADGNYHGFILKDEGLTTIDYPGAGYTDVRGIGPDGDVVGTFADLTEEAAAYHGFKRTAAGEFVPVHYSGHLYEIPQRILADGTILGCRHDHDLAASMKGFVARDGESEITAFASMNNGATPSLAHVVGQYTNTAANRTEAYDIENGVFSPFIVPGSMMTSAWDINQRGDVVGIFRNAAGFHGYVRTEDGFTTIDVAGATATRAYGINARGDVVGTFASGGRMHGFLARRVR